MFNNAINFNQPLNNWDVSNVTDMSLMFTQAFIFDQALNNWNVSNVTNMCAMFSETQVFNQPLNSWVVTNVTNIVGMFYSAESFNQPLNSWDVSNVTNMSTMFEGAINFNQPLNNWDVSNVTYMDRMFYNALSFNQDISDWVFNPNINFSSFLAYSNLSSENYDALLQSFVNQNLHDKELFAGGLSYCDASARNELINNMGWSIEGDTTTSTNIAAPSNIVVSADPWVCHATNVDLGTPFAESCLDYSISNNAPEVFPLGQTVVIWTITDEAGITETSSQNVTVTQQSDNATICYVTTDDVEYSKNRIFINYNDGLNVDRYEVLRETSANIFSPIGFINPGETSFLDETSNNATQTYRYTVRTRDICQQTSPQSPVHTTMLLQSNVAANNSVNLNWNPYQGTTYGSFEIYRSIDQGPFELLATLPGTNTAYNDVQANIDENNYEYYVAIQVQPCSAKLNGAQIRSNREAVGNSVDIQSATLTNQLILYPNPSSSMIYIQAPAWLEIKEVKLLNLEGQLIGTYRQKIEFNVENLNSGIYFIQVFSEHGVITKKFTKN
jgi:surface protein